MDKLLTPQEALPWRILFGIVALTIGVGVFLWLGEKPSYWPSIVVVFWIIGWKLGFNFAHYRKRRRIWHVPNQENADDCESPVTPEASRLDLIE